MTALHRLRAGALATWGALVLAASIAPIVVWGAPWTQESYTKFRASMAHRAEIRRAEAAVAARVQARRDRTIMRQVRDGHAVIVATKLGRLPGLTPEPPVGVAAGDAPSASTPADSGPAVELSPIVLQGG